MINVHRLNQDSSGSNLRNVLWLNPTPLAFVTRERTFPIRQ